MIEGFAWNISDVTHLYGSACCTSAGSPGSPQVEFRKIRLGVLRRKVLTGAPAPASGSISWYPIGVPWIPAAVE